MLQQTQMAEQQVVLHQTDYRKSQGPCCTQHRAQMIGMKALQQHWQLQLMTENNKYTVNDRHQGSCTVFQYFRRLSGNCLMVANELDSTNSIFAEHLQQSVCLSNTDL